jgi:hypothetical protein
MHRHAGRATAVFILLGTMARLAGAAPLDALLDVSDAPGALVRWSAEAMGDVTQPVFDAVGANRQVGHTESIRLGMVSGPWTFAMGGHQRAVHDKSNDYQVQSWNAAAQYEPGPGFFGGTAVGSPWRWALRLGAWGNRAGQLVQSTNSVLKVSGLKARLVEMELVQPRDLQLQFDLVGHYDVPVRGWALSGFAGLGSSEVTRSVVSGKAAISGCTYQLQFGDARLNAMPLADCPKALIVSIPNSLLKVDVLQETRYRSVYGHAGGAVHWQDADWRLALGGELQQWQRTGADELRTRNAILVAEVGRAITPSVSAVLRGQYQHRQLLSEAPMLFNARSAGTARRHVGQVSVGLLAQF